MYNKLFALTVLGCAVIAFLSNEASAKKNKYRDPSGSFTTRKKSGKDTFMIIDDSQGANVIVVELQLGNLGNNEFLMITDNPPVVGADEEQKITYTMMGNQLKVLDQSYDAITRGYERAPSDVVNFESFTGRVFIKYDGKNTGEVTGKYQVYHKQQLCAKSDLTVTSGGIDCDDDLAGFATECRGEFTCPKNSIMTRTATCRLNEWRDACFPNQAALEALGACTGDLTNCTDSGILNDLIEVMNNATPGRSSSSVVSRLKKMCPSYCNFKTKRPTKHCYNDYFPKDFSNKMAMRRFKNCSICVYIYKCDLDAVRMFR